MLDIKFIRENKEEIKKAIGNKNINLNLNALLDLDKKRLEMLQEIEGLKGIKNDLNDRMKQIKNDGERQEIIAKGKEIKERLEKTEPKFEKIKKEFFELMAKVPIIPSPDTPIGKSDKKNLEIYRSGEIPKFDFKPKTHIEIGKDLDILDFERGAKVGGYRGYYVKNEGVFLMMGFMMYAFGKMAEKGYMPMIVPTLIKEFPLFGSGYFKGMKYDPESDEIYEVATPDKEADGTKSREKKFLVGTAEPSLLAYYSGEVLKEEQLPIRMSGYSQCYRSEIGSYGKETKGMYRVHEFMKVEQVILGKDDVKEAEKLQDEMVAISKEMHKELGLSHRQLVICTGDLGVGKYRQYDLETWLPGMDRWGETGSASIFLDWQARRLNVKYEDKNGDKKFVYMLNNTALPSPRIFIAILENYQQKDGSVKIPEILVKYMPKKMKYIRKK